MSGTPVVQAYTAALSAACTVYLHHDDGTVQRHDVDRWIAEADPVDLRLLARCTGPTLDLGCGPGRLVAALAGRGIPALGVDQSVRAVELARARGAAAICRDLFSPLPGEGRWSAALLVDGNIGIGGDPVRLLRRVAGLLTRQGVALVEVADQDVDRRGVARLRLADGSWSRPFQWAELGLPTLATLAPRAGWGVTEHWRDAGRTFAALSRRARSFPTS